MPPDFADPYTRLKRHAGQDLRSSAVRNLLAQLAAEGFRFLTEECNPLGLTTTVAGKSYVAFQFGDGAPSRPVRADLFPADRVAFARAVRVFRGDLSAVDAATATGAIYAIAMGFCAANDAAKRGDRATPARVFEILAAHLVARVLGVNPRTSIRVLDMDTEHAELPTDYWFDLGHRARKIHLPVKTSTRERAIQVWAHQRILDGVFGAGRLTGILVALAETKLDRASLDVIEICVPDQWRLYQRYVATIHRVYYLDPPAAYIALAPDVEVRTIGEMFAELIAIRDSG